MVRNTRNHSQGSPKFMRQIGINPGFDEIKVLQTYNFGLGQFSAKQKAIDYIQQ